MNTGANAPAHNRLFAAVCTAALIVFALQCIVLGSRAQIFGDFHAFYCGGAAVLHGSDPYAGVSLAACEQQAQPFGLHSTERGVIAPVPFPGYAFAVFAPFAALPYVPSAMLWLLLLLACTAVGIVLVARLANVSLWCSAAVVVPGYAIAVLGLGEVAPIVLTALCSAALALRKDRMWAAAAALCAAALLPHVLLPVFAAAFIFAPRIRLPLIACGAMLAALDLALTGPAAAIEYFTRVLPAHAQSEIGYIAQYGLTWILHGIGLNDRAALLTADASYAAVCTAGVAAAALFARKTRDGAALALLPAAFAVIGGPFMHYSEITLAFPGILLVYSRTEETVKSLAAAAIVLLAVPWQWIVGEPQLALPVALLAAFAVTYALGMGREAALRAALGTLVYSAALLFVATAAGPQVAPMHAAHVASDLAQASWTAYIRAQGASAGVVWWIAKLPTWTGLLLLGACGCYAAAHKDFVAARIVERVPARP